MTNQANRIETHRGALRVLLLVLGIPQGLAGLQALVDRRGFYDGFPFGRGWVADLPPFNEHLVLDVGALFVGLGVLMIGAAILLDRRVVLLAVAVWLCFAVPHAIYHFTELEAMGSADAVANSLTLAGAILNALLVLALVRRPRPAGAGATAAHAGANGSASNGMRMPGVPDRGASLISRIAFRASRRQTGAVVDPVRIYAHHPVLMTGYGALEEATKRSHRVPEATKALAEMRAAMLAGCEWCLDFGSVVARESGLSDEQLRALPAYRDSDLFSEPEKLVLDYATGMSRTPVEVSDELFAALREHFDEAQMVELTNAIAIENYRARFNWAFGLGSQGFSEGSFCVKPEMAATETAPLGAG